MNRMEHKTARRMRVKGQSAAVLLLVAVLREGGVVMMWMRWRQIVRVQVMMVQVEWHREHRMLQTGRHHGAAGAAVVVVLVVGARRTFVLHGCNWAEIIYVRRVWINLCCCVFGLFDLS